MRIKPFDVGVESVTLWQHEDEVHLPADGRAAPAFLPEVQALDEIVNRPRLDERLPDLLIPANLDPGLLEPAALSDVRAGLQLFFERESQAADLQPEDRDLFGAAGRLLGDDMTMDTEVRAALAMLLRG
ncbi:hypothetical protein [Aureimonas sp. AU4]|uniref:type III secretion apparatus assembly protein SctX n=1 Tax=Aureimonas sp. AU4 TaxID=1638163 RepID=UPI000783250A|nr:hypothetical protein [Aureimonas sp. AU4]